MVILREATIKYKGYDPDSLTHGSNKRICVSCDQCGRIRWVGKAYYRDLCKSCSMIDKNKGQKRSNEFKKEISIIRKQWHKDHPNALLGKNNPMYGKLVSNETRKKISKSNLGKTHNNETKEKIRKSKIGNKNPMYGVHLYGELNGNYKGGFDNSRPYLTPKNRCIKLNSYFKGSNAHHIMKGVIIYMPGDLHNSQYHDLKNNKNMDKINKLALSYLIGDY